MAGEQTEAPGLRRITRPDGTIEYRWFATEEAKRAGFSLSEGKQVVSKRLHVDCGRDDIPARCRALQTQMLKWLVEQAGDRGVLAQFNDTFASLIKIYRGHPDSTYHQLTEGSRHSYDVYANLLEGLYGKRRVSALSGLDIKRMHEQWRGDDGGKFGAAATALAVLKAALSFGISANLEGCDRLLLMISKLSLPGPKPRTQVADAEAIILARRAAHALGAPRAALGYALQFEGCIRAWDLIGEWVPLDDPRPSDIVRRLRAGTRNRDEMLRKWIGPRWSQIDGMILSLTPTKTARTTGKVVMLDLSEMPMVVEEINRIPAKDRNGPLVRHSESGVPYTAQQWTCLWREVREQANLPDDLWNRDLRASGVTEGGQAGASSDDRAKVAGHSTPRMVKSVYDRDIIEGGRRVSASRNAFREQARNRQT